MKLCTTQVAGGLAVFLGVALLSGCQTTSPTKGNSQSSKATVYQNWTTSQLQSKRTQLMIASAKPDLKIDPINGGSYVPQHPGRNQELDEINAELLRRDPTGQLLGSP